MTMKAEREREREGEGEGEGEGEDGSGGDESGSTVAPETPLSALPAAMGALQLQQRSSLRSTPEWEREEEVAEEELPFSGWLTIDGQRLLVRLKGKSLVWTHREPSGPRTMSLFIPNWRIGVVSETVEVSETERVVNKLAEGEPLFKLVLEAKSTMVMGKAPVLASASADELHAWRAVLLERVPDAARPASAPPAVSAFTPPAPRKDLMGRFARMKQAQAARVAAGTPRVFTPIGATVEGLGVPETVADASTE